MFSGVELMHRLIITFGLLVTLVLFTDILCSDYTKAKYQYRIVTVERGDTLWCIAAKHTTHKQDIRELIARIKQTNNIDKNVEIYPGQVLQVPVKIDDVDQPLWANLFR